MMSIIIFRNYSTCYLIHYIKIHIELSVKNTIYTLYTVREWQQPRHGNYLIHDNAMESSSTKCSLYIMEMGIIT